MTVARLLALVLVALGAAVALPDHADAAPGPPVAAVQRRRLRRLVQVGSVTVTWEFDPAGVTSTSGCGAAGVTEDTSGHGLHVRRQLRRPVLRQQRDRGEGLVAAADRRASLARGPDADGWYTKPDLGLVRRGRRSLGCRVVQREAARTAAPTAARSRSAAPAPTTPATPRRRR